MIFPFSFSVFQFSFSLFLFRRVKSMLKSFYCWTMWIWKFSTVKNQKQKSICLTWNASWTEGVRPRRLAGNTNTRWNWKSSTVKLRYTYIQKWYVYTHFIYMVTILSNRKLNIKKNNSSDPGCRLVRLDWAGLTWPLWYSNLLVVPWFYVRN